MYFPKDIYSLRKVYKYVIQNNYDYFIIGKGTNLVIDECYFNKVFINLKKLDQYFYLKDNKVLVLSGAFSSKIAYTLAKHKYTGCEFLSVIPGTIGGAVYMNAGAYNNQMSDIIDSVLIIDNDGHLKLIKNNECGFAYRYSNFKKEKNIILGTILKLKKVDNEKIPLEKIRLYVSNKKDNQPLNAKSAGSTFLNPKGVQAWELIDKIGYRGKVFGGAKVSEKHANFLINHNHASFSDIYNLMLEITLNVKNHCNIDLECEWEILK